LLNYQVYLARSLQLNSNLSPREITFRADHPFIFIIQQKEAGNILFMGKGMDPGKG